MKRTSTAVWSGSGKEGSGHLSTTSGVLNKSPYSWKSRFADGIGTNPEELIAAAHAGCFCMKLSFILGNSGFTPDSLEANCSVNIDNGTIDTSHIVLKAKIPGITNEKFQECVTEAKTTCPVSKALNAAITVEASLA